MASGYPQGQPTDLFREHVALNAASFSATSGVISDLWRETANIGPMPARNTHSQDTTAYAAQPAQGDSWQVRLRGYQSPAQVTAGIAGATSSQGQLT
jgi:hypothetical protein